MKLKTTYKKSAMVLRISIFVCSTHFCMGLPHTKVGLKRLIHVATIACNHCRYGYLVLALVNELGHSLRTTSSFKAGENITYRLRTTLFDQMLRQVNRSKSHKLVFFLQSKATNRDLRFFFFFANRHPLGKHGGGSVTHTLIRCLGAKHVSNPD